MRFREGGRGIAVIISGTLGAQLITLAAYPVLTRLFTSQEFGAYALVYAWATLVFPVAALRLDAIVPLPETDREAQRLVGIGVRIALTAGVLGAAAVFAGQEVWPRLGDIPWLWLIPVLGALIAVFQLVNAWGIRKARYSAIARRTLAQAVVLVAVQVTAGVLGAAAGGLLLGITLAFLASIALLVVGSGMDRHALHGGWAVPARHRRASTQLTLAGLLNGAGLQAPILLMTALYGLGAGGQFALAQQAVAVPLALIGQAVAQVYLGRLAQHLRDVGGTARPHFLAATRPLAACAGPTALLAFVLSPWLFPVVFGSEWRTSGLMVAALSLALGFQLVAAPLSQTLIVVGAANVQLAWDAARLALIVAALVVPAALGAGPLAAVWWYSGTSALTYAALWLLALRVSGRCSPNQTSATAEPLPPSG